MLRYFFIRMLCIFFSILFMFKKNTIAFIALRYPVPVHKPLRFDVVTFYFCFLLFQRATE